MLRHPQTQILQKDASTVRKATKSSAVALRARQNALLADNVLRQTFTEAKLNVGQVLQLGQRMQALTGPISLAQVLPLLPPKLAAQIVQSQSKALLHMLLAWGQSLREQAALAKKAQLRRNAQAQEVKGHVQAYQMRAVAAARQLRAQHALAAQARGVQHAYGSDDQPATNNSSDRLNLASASLTSGLNRPMMEALSAPLATGFSLRGATLRLSRHG